MKRTPALVIAVSFLAACAALAADDRDPYLWLEEVEGHKALSWAKEQNQKTTADLGKVKQYKPILERTLQILDSKERIPSPDLIGDMVYNFWQDKDHPRGIWRRATLTSYRTAAPQWETVIDVDALVQADDIPWAFKGADCLPPERRLCLVSLVEGSPDGIVRAFPLMHPDFDIEAFDVVILKHYLDAPGKLVPDNNQYRVGPVRIPQPDDGLLEFRYTGGPGTYRRFSYFDVVDPERLDVLNRHVKFDQVVRNSIVLVGCTLLDQKDYFAHPIHDREPIAGLEVHANILQTMIESGHIESAPLHLVYTLLVVLGFSTVMATLWVRTWLAIGITVVVLTGFTAVCYFAYAGMNMTIPWSYPALAIVLGYLVTGSSLRLRIKLAEMWGPYQLLDELGEAGMAIVYRARNKKTRDIVALKVMLPHLGSQGNTTRRFIREIAAASRLDHPNVVRILDVGEVGGQPYASMELVDGVDLQKYLDKVAPLAPHEAIPLAIQAADGLHAAHVMGIVHRDVKPSNFMLSKDGCLKIMDFGLAIATDQTQFTLTRSVLGTPDFMSPEQCRGEHVDDRADVYAFGAMLYLMLTGKKVFTGDTSFALVQKHLNEPAVPLATHVTGLPEELNDIVLKCLAKDPKDRFQTIHEVRDRLQSVLRTLETKPT